MFGHGRDNPEENRDRDSYYERYSPVTAVGENRNLPLNSLERLLQRIGKHRMIRNLLMLPWSLCVILTVGGFIYFIVGAIALTVAESITGNETTPLINMIVVVPFFAAPEAVGLSLALHSSNPDEVAFVTNAFHPGDTAWDAAVRDLTDPLGDLYAPYAFRSWQSWLVIILELFVIWTIIMIPFAIRYAAKHHDSFWASLFDHVTLPGAVWNRTIGRIFLRYLQAQSKIIVLLLPIILIVILVLCFTLLSGIHLIWANQFGRAYGLNPTLFLVTVIVLTLLFIFGTLIFMFCWLIMAAPIILPILVGSAQGVLLPEWTIPGLPRGLSANFFIAVLVIVIMGLFQWLPNLVRYYGSDKARHMSWDILSFFPFAPAIDAPLLGEAAGFHDTKPRGSSSSGGTASIGGAALLERQPEVHRHGNSGTERRVP